LNHKNATMKKLGLLFIIIISLQACNVLKAPEFKGIKQIDLKQKQNGKLILVAYAQYHNPNLLGGKFEIKDIAVSVNDKFLANLNAKTYKVPAKKDFEVPLEVDFDEKFLKKDNLLDALGSLLNNKMKIHYLGKIYYVSHKIRIPYKIDYQQDVKLIE